ncbi:Protein-tyrosine-phosphatase MKP1 [Hibiscus syriacus]|uniref:Protein-tyrosine-phosphatase MKP1 n=1 Tax=Hibiscus syriacus TaxID=106335 RepID=A0A6A2Y343_HIBSY|nr:protein-tyrosine-phosphatase MKP1-like [Hibiscus syriacus]XP_039044109.1 protein-tyrosine-phosphatase MKP1-like [Hibiscus syriacus]KAE8664437.1 Protein-tyrosine-phosphatase MKP1 [Hibiscus syriacus]
MVGKEDVPASPRAPSCQVSSSRKMFWRSASWSASQTSGQIPLTEDKDLGEGPKGNDGSNNNGQTRRFPPPPLTPRSQQNCKARSCLPPLQPLSIARRSLDEWPKAGSDDLGEWPQPPTPSGNKSGERLKLDLSSIQWNNDNNGGLLKRDKIAFFDKECSKVAEHIYLGGDAVAKDREILKTNGITHVLNCVGFVCPEYFKADFVYRTLWLQDSPSEDITSILYDVFDYFEDVKELGGRIFVHCCQGVSRSTSLVIAYLMWREGQSFDDAFQYVKAARGIADPNMGFACQLLQCQKRVHAFPLSPSSILRMYRIAPHSPYDPLHLVPKMLNDPSLSGLDSRGAFIVHIPSAIYIWIGKNCDSIMERDARGAVCQIVRYERVQGPIIAVKEGEEPSCFWNAFSNLLPLMDKSRNKVEVGESAVKICHGERKVDSYNVDFEIFEKAIKGGFVPPFASSENELETHLPERESSWSMLRCKFASGVTEFVSTPKILFSRVYSDSMMIVHSSSPSSTSSSSPYLSPDSISSDSSTCSKCLSESSLDSPSSVSYSLPVSTLSNLSNLSLVSSRTSSHLKSNSTEIGSADFTSQPCSQSASSLVQKVSPSLAERRGSLSKSLKLPVVSDNVRNTNERSCFLVKKGGIQINKDYSSSCESDIEIVFDSKPGGGNGVDILIQGSGLKISPGRLANVDSRDTNYAFVKTCESPENPPQDGLASSVPNRMEESILACPGVLQPLVCRWPSIEKMTKFNRTDLDSKSAFAIFCPTTAMSKNEDWILYLWIGRSFHQEKSLIQLDNGRLMGDREDIDCDQVGCDLPTQMGLPKDIPVKIVNEDEEPTEFLMLLKMM